MSILRGPDDQGDLFAVCPPRGVSAGGVLGDKAATWEPEKLIHAGNLTHL